MEWGHTSRVKPAWSRVRAAGSHQHGVGSHQVGRLADNVLSVHRTVNRRRTTGQGRSITTIRYNAIRYDTTRQYRQYVVGRGQPAKTDVTPATLSRNKIACATAHVPLATIRINIHRLCTTFPPLRLLHKLVAANCEIVPIFSLF